MVWSGSWRFNVTEVYRCSVLWVTASLYITQGCLYYCHGLKYSSDIFAVNDNFHE